MKINSIGIYNVPHIKSVEDRAQTNPLKKQIISKDIVSFFGDTKERIAKDSMRALAAHIESDKPLTEADEEWLSPLRYILGADYMEIKILIIPMKQ